MDLMYCTNEHLWCIGTRKRWLWSDRISVVPEGVYFQLLTAVHLRPWIEQEYENGCMSINIYQMNYN